MIFELARLDDILSDYAWLKTWFCESGFTSLEVSEFLLLTSLPWS